MFPFKQYALTTKDREYSWQTRQLNERIDAVEELLKTDNPKKAHAQSLLKQLPDLEKGLSRIHYGRVRLFELVLSSKSLY